MLGFALPQFGESVHAELTRFASTAEQLGAESLWVGDRLLAAVQPSVGYAGGAMIPQNFRTSLDPFTALTVAAAVTTSARLGFSALVAPWYPPVQLARQPTVSFQGDRYRIPPSWVSLKPVQRTHPPAYLGAFSAPGLARIGRRADGWPAVADVPGGVRIDRLATQRRAIDDAAHAAGRDPAGIATHVRANVAPGTPIEDVEDAVKTLQDNGYSDVFVDMLYVVTDPDGQLEWVQRLLAVDS